MAATTAAGRYTVADGAEVYTEAHECVCEGVVWDILLPGSDTEVMYVDM